jgi:hypothetical protein
MHDHPRRGAPAHSPRWRRPRLAALVGVLALMLAVAACTGGGDKGSGVASLGGTGSATSTTAAGGGGDDRQKALNWAKCMRQHGINLPDPRFDAQGNMIPPEPPAVANAQAKLKFKAADQACKQYEPSGGPPPSPPSAQERQQALAFARCMRQHGINVPDPQITANGIAQPLPEGMDRDDPRLRAPRQACRQYLPNNLTEQAGG